MDSSIYQVNLALRKEIESLKLSINNLNHTLSKKDEEINRLKDFEIKCNFRKSYNEMCDKYKLKATITIYFR